MNDLGSRLERVAEAGVVTIALHPLRQPGDRRRARTRTFATVAAICLMVAAVATAASIRSSGGHPSPPIGGSALTADASWTVPSEGMSPTLQVGDVVSGATKFGAIERGDVVRVRFPSTIVPTPPGGEFVLKRVIALPGETVAGRGGQVLVNSRVLAEPYLQVTTGDFAPIVVPAGSYFVMGDNRANSADSRQRGAVPRSAVVGIALRITSPASRAGAIPGSPR